MSFDTQEDTLRTKKDGSTLKHFNEGFVELMRLHYFPETSGVNTQYLQQIEVVKFFMEVYGFDLKTLINYYYRSDVLGLMRALEKVTGKKYSLEDFYNEIRATYMTCELTP